MLPGHAQQVFNHDMQRIEKGRKYSSGWRAWVIWFVIYLAVLLPLWFLHNNWIYYPTMIALIVGYWVALWKLDAYWEREERRVWRKFMSNLHGYVYGDGPQDAK